MVNWDALGAIGEIVGALAVVLTLVYLSRQISHARSEIRRQQSQDTNEMFNSLHCAIAASPELAEAMALAEQGEELSSRQFIQYRHSFIALMNAFENTYIQQQETGEANRIALVSRLTAVSDGADGFTGRVLKGFCLLDDVEITGSV